MCTTASIGGSSVDVTATKTDPGSGTDGTDSKRHSTLTPVDPDPDTNPQKQPDADADTDTDTDTDETEKQPGPGIQCDYAACPRVVKETETDPGTDVTATDPVTMADIDQFNPVTGSTGMEPNGWTPIGLDANFYSDAAAHVVSGVLLDNTADVRFTPIAWHWDYGDGVTKDSTVGGASWTALGVDEFAATATSHRYERAGDFDVRVGIEYGAEYRFAGGEWTAIDGSLTVQGPPLHARSGTASTVLVSSDCGADPAAPGC